MSILSLYITQFIAFISGSESVFGIKFTIDLWFYPSYNICTGNKLKSKHFAVLFEVNLEIIHNRYRQKCQNIHSETDIEDKWTERESYAKPNGMNEKWKLWRALNIVWKIMQKERPSNTMMVCRASANGKPNREINSIQFTQGSINDIPNIINSVGETQHSCHPHNNN